MKIKIFQILIMMLLILQACNEEVSMKEIEEGDEPPITNEEPQLSEFYIQGIINGDTIDRTYTIEENYPRQMYGQNSYTAVHRIEGPIMAFPIDSSKGIQFRFRFLLVDSLFCDFPCRGIQDIDMFNELLIGNEIELFDWYNVNKSTSSVGINYSERNSTDQKTFFNNETGHFIIKSRELIESTLKLEGNLECYLYNGRNHLDSIQVKNLCFKGTISL